MPTIGMLRLGDKSFQVNGASWMDHEFGTSALEPDQIGWDWFSIQLEDGTDLMVFRLRRRDGRADPHSSGTVVTVGGRPQTLTAAQFSLIPGATWLSPVSGATYPVEWTVSVPARDLHLEVTAALPDQELTTERSSGVTYWEGMIDVRGREGARQVVGRGYLEMTGYAGRPMGETLR
jgi:predicted secreted hydrolase